MHTVWENVWSFETARFKVMYDVAEDYDLDLSWDDTGEVRDKLESGEYVSFVARIAVYLDHNMVGSDHLGGCIYTNANEFRDHFGIKAQENCGSYFSDMVRNAIQEARKNLSNIPNLRKAK